VDVPYASKIPPRACIASWPVDEVNGMAFVWHDRDRGEPDYRIPEIPEYGQDEFLPWDHKRLLIRTQPKEIVENVADKAHFIPVHGTHISDFENVYEGHLATQLTKGVAYPLGGGEDPFDLDATYHGPAYQLTVMEGVMKSFLFNAHTPIDEHSLHLRFGVSLRVLPKYRDRMAEFSGRYVSNLTLGFEQDIRIWENKLYRNRPTLCDGDGPIGKLRRWYRQFYAPREVA
jgi:3-ketosteroid 9alpha-monooxygenase subunit A